MQFLFHSIAAETYVADRRVRLEQAASDHRAVVGAITAALATATSRIRHARHPAPALPAACAAAVVVALPATAPATDDDDQAAAWPVERVA